MGDPGEANNGALRLDFDSRVLLQFRGSTITSDGRLTPIGYEAGALRHVPQMAEVVVSR